MITTNLKRVTFNLKVLEDRLQEISKNKIQSGYLTNEEHPNDTGITYPELMKAYEFGHFYGYKYPVRETTKRIFLSNKAYLKKFIEDMVFSNDPVRNHLEEAGKNLSLIAKGIFGSMPPLPDYRTSNPTPLLDTKKLRDAWDYEIVRK